FAADRLRADKRHGARHPRSRHRAHLRAVLLDADEGHGPRSLGHDGHRAPPRRSHRGDERRGAGHDLQRHSPRGFADTLGNGCRTESLTASSRPTATAPRKSRASSSWTTRRTCASPRPPYSNRRATKLRPRRAVARPWRWPRTHITTSCSQTCAWTTWTASRSCTSFRRDTRTSSPWYSRATPQSSLRL